MASASCGSPAGVPVPAERIVNNKFSHICQDAMPTVRFKELAAVSCFFSIETSSSIGLADQCLLRDVTRHRNTRSSPILVDARLADDTFNIVAIEQRLAESLQDYCGDAFLYNPPKRLSQYTKLYFARRIMPMVKKTLGAYTSCVSVGCAVPHAGSASRRKHVQLALRDVVHCPFLALAVCVVLTQKMCMCVLGDKIKLDPAAMAVLLTPLLSCCTARCTATREELHAVSTVICI